MAHARVVACLLVVCESGLALPAVAALLNVPSTEARGQHC